MKTIIEPFRIKCVEPIRMASRGKQAAQAQRTRRQASRPVEAALDQECTLDSTRPCLKLPMSPEGQRYCLLFQQSLAGIYTTTVDGRILDCNDAMAAMLRYKSRPDLMSRPTSDLYFGGSDRRDFLRRLQETGKLVNSECRLKRKDGTAVFVLENVSLAPDENGRPRIIHGNAVDITDRKLAEEALRQSEQAHRSLTNELRRLADRQEAVREGERTRIARELHDEFGQALTALNMDLHWLAARTQEGKAEVRSRIHAMAQLVGNTAETLHRICADLRPTVLDDFGLIAAVEWEAREFHRRTGIRCQVRLPRRSRCPLPKEQATAVFRIFQASLTNVGRHSHASEANATLTIRNGFLTMSVSDNGKGISSRAMSDANSLGLIGMRERALAWGGQLDLSGSRANGTTVTLRMPVAPGGPVPRT